MLIYNYYLKNAFLPLLVLFSLQLSAQQDINIKGKIIDSTSRELLPFVHIEALGMEATNGTVSDIDGLFQMRIAADCKAIKFSYVGYEPKIIPIDNFDINTENIVSLSPSAFNTAEVVVLAGENPAYRIIRSAIANRKENNPEKLKSFRYESYNKAILFNEQNAPKEPFSIRDSSLSTADSSKMSIYFMMMESVTARSYYYPNKDKEEILGTRVSGFNHPGFAPLATAFQPFSFYRDPIIILDKEFINPIGNGSINRYEYRLEDTLYSGNDTTFVISFFPRKGRNFDAMKGVLYINTNGFAVEYVLAEPAEKGLLDIRFEQKYVFTENKQWFPVQLNFELRLNPYNEGWFTLQGKSYLRNIEIEPDNLKKKDFGNLSVEMLKDAEKQKEDFWKKYREQELTKKEELTYLFLDSLGKALNFDNIAQFAQDVPRGLLPIGPLALNLAKIMDYNPFEKFRLGLGLYTSSKFSKQFIIGGYFGYGFGDKKWKYGGDFIFHIAPKKDISMQIRYERDVSEPAPLFERGGILSQWVSPQETFARRYVLSRMDYKEGVEASFYFRFLRNIQLRPFVSVYEITPGYNYNFINEAGVTLNRFSLFNVGAQMRWSYKEKYAEFNGRRSLVESRYPVLYAAYFRGLSVAKLGVIEYQKVVAGLEANIFIKGLGRTRLDIQAGWTDRPLPFSLLFNGRGSYQPNLGIYTRNSFQTMDVTEFVSSQFIYAFWTHNFGRIRGIKSERIRPEVKICQSVGFGSLRDINRHIGIPISTMEKGFYESGLLLDNLLCMKAANMAYVGLGVGAFYRYGPYSIAKTVQNFAFKISLSASL